VTRFREKKVLISVSVRPGLKAELENEAWEEQRTLSQYVSGLLERRGKWARTVGCAGGYDLMHLPYRRKELSDKEPKELPDKVRKELSDKEPPG